jgi:hypothetical protein
MTIGGGIRRPFASQPISSDSSGGSLIQNIVEKDWHARKGQVNDNGIVILRMTDFLFDLHLQNQIFLYLCCRPLSPNVNHQFFIFCF